MSVRRFFYHVHSTSVCPKEDYSGIINKCLVKTSLFEGQLITVTKWLMLICFLRKDEQ
jgi:hypothetical protein